MEKGKFITLEGCEGVGKSTQLRLLKEYIERAGIDAVFTREPGGTEISEQIRSVILSTANTSMSAECEALLYAAARVQLIDEVILPALESGKTVVCDRYLDSSLAYQAYARGLGVDTVEKINFYAIEHAMPDVTVFLDLEPCNSFRRQNGHVAVDRLENENAEFHNRVYQGFVATAARYPGRFIKFRPTGTKYETSAAIIKLLKDRGIF